MRFWLLGAGDGLNTLVFVRAFPYFAIGDPSVGDITYYPPWGNVAFFYRDFGYSRGLVKLGRLDSRLDAFDRPEMVRVSIGRLDE